MFICGSCGQSSDPREKPINKIVQTRNVEYPGGSKGWEIVKEIKVCSQCSEMEN